MKIALLGYGKMGRAIEDVALKSGHEIILKADREGFDAGDLRGADVAIDFSTPNAVVSNLHKCVEANIPAVVGTTAWYEHYEEITQNFKSANLGLLTATNFSIGVNLFWKIVQHASKLLNSYPEYDVSLEEIHHLQKLDAPSGTAITTAERILNSLDRKNKWVHHESGNLPSKNPLHLNIESKREAGVPGTHEVSFNGDIDSIEIKHTAHSRMGFAKGAVVAAEWLVNRKGIYTMDNVLNA